MPVRSAVFLDKDGTLLDDVPFNVDPARMRFAPGADEALARLGATGLPIFVISNQSGVAQGRFTEAELEPVRRRLDAMFAECGARLTRFYYCPHHPQAAVRFYARQCVCRKPQPGLLKQAAAEHFLDLANSWMIGDILDDVEAGRRAGCRTVLVDNGNETEWRRTPMRTPHHIVRRLDEAARTLVTWHEAGATPAARVG